MSANSAGRPWWHGLTFRLSVRAVLILVLTVGIVMWTALAPGLERHRATTLILRHRGSYLYDYQFKPPSLFFQNPRSPYPNWARRALGDEHFHHVTLVLTRQEN